MLRSIPLVQCRSTWPTAGRFLLAGLLLACMVGLTLSAAAMQRKPGWKTVLRYNPTPVSAPIRIPAPRLRAGAPLSTIHVTYHNFSSQAQTAFQAAVDVWASLVYSPVPITIDATWGSLGSTTGILGQAGPNEIFSDFTGAPVAGTWYPKALADALAGKDQDSTSVDIMAEFNSDFPDWYYGTDGNTPSTKIDLETVVLHECCHELGFLGTTDMTGRTGSWGQDGLPIIFDKFTVNGSNQSLLNTSLFPNPSQALGTLLTSDNLFFNGPKAMAANNGAKPKLYAPSSWESGSSGSHLDEDTYPFGSSINALMTPALPAGISLHDPGPIVKGVFADIGWTSGTTSTVATPTFSPDGGTYTSAQNVTISCTTTGASIYYTTNSNDPTTSDTLYQSPVAIAATTTLKAKAFATGKTASAVKSAVYTIQQSTSYVVTPTAGANGSLYPYQPQSVSSGANIIFYATPSIGYAVDSWRLDGIVVQTGGTQYTLQNITANHSVQVTFKLLTYTVTPSAGTNGTITPSTPQTVNSGDTLVFLATANAGYTVDSWSLDGEPWQAGGSTFTLAIITADHTVSVNFKALSFTVTPTAGTGGAISPSTAQTVDGGANLTFTATPGSGYVVDSWYLDGANTPAQTGGTTYALKNILADHAVKVTFKVPTFTVTPTAGTGGTISPSTIQTVNSGASLTFTATPGSGYAVDGWYLDSATTPAQTGGTIYALTNITANHTVKVTFKPGTILVTPTAGTGGTISPSTVQTVSTGASLTFTATPGSGYVVNGWYLDGATTPAQTGGVTYTLTNITVNHAVKVTFKAASSTITPTAGTGGTISPSSTQTVNFGTSLTFIAMSNSAFTVDSWYLDSSTTPAQVGGTTYSLTNITANHAIKVTFKSTVMTVTPSAGTGGAISPNTVQTVTVGASLTFTATPNSGYLVDGWYLDSATTPAQVGGTTYALTNITVNHAVKVTFKTIAIIVTPSAGTGGSISPSTAQTVSSGASLTFTASPNSGYAVNGWYLDGAATPAQAGGLTYTLANITTSHSLKVTFETGTITVTPTAGTGGTISPSTVKLVNPGAHLTFTALPYSGFAVNGWYLDDATTPAQAGGATYTLTNIIVNHAVNVTFKPATFIITPSAGTGGTINPSTPQTVSYGTKYPLTATPAGGYVVDSWYVDNATTPVQVGGATYLLPTITANHSVKVTFKTVFFIVTPSAGANGTISPATPQSVQQGNSVTFTAKPNTGFLVANWTYDGSIVYPGGLAANGAYTGLTCVLNNIKANHTLAVTFKTLLMYTITASAGGNGAISPSTTRTAPYGGSLTFTALANTGYVTDTWSLDGASVQTGGTQYTLQNITANHAVKVTFKSLYYKTDLSICNNGDAGYIGLGVINLAGSSQTKTQTVASGVAATYLFRVQNSGDTTDTFTLTCALPALSGWQVQCLDRVTGKDVTTTLTGVGYTTVALAPGVAGGFTLQITPTSTAMSGTAYPLLITAVSSHDATKKDTVKAITMKQ